MKLVIPGEPMPKERPRKGQHGNFYTPRGTKAYERMVATYAMAAREKFDGPVKLSVRIYTSNKRSDDDNIFKAVADGLQGHAFKNDQQICEHHVKRIWSTNPRVEVVIEETEQEIEDPSAAA